MSSIKKILKKKLINFALQGDNVECVCCGKTFVTFLPAGIKKRTNARCPNCGALERHRMVWLFIERETELLKKPMKLLHSAPEIFFYHKLKKLSTIDYTAIDKYPDEYTYSAETLDMDLTDLKFNDNSFDFIICNHVLEHIQDDHIAMQEMFRVLKPGGKALLNVPFEQDRATTFEDHMITDPQRRLELFGQPDHVRLYSGKDYVKRLTDAGFSVQQIDYVGSFSAADQFKYGLQKGEDMFFCTKP